MKGLNHLAMSEEFQSSTTSASPAFTCSFCGNRRGSVWSRATNHLRPDDTRTFIYMRCSDCGLVALQSPPTPEEMAREYPEDAYWSTPDARPGIAESVQQAYRNLIFREEIRRARSIVPPCTMLDAGCGNGFVAGIFAEYGYSVTGIDLSPVAVNIARQHYGIEAICGRFSAAAFPGKTFAFINMDYFLEHVPTPSQALMDASSLLQPGGWLRMTLPNADSIQAHMFGPRWFDIEAPRHYSLFAVPTIGRMLHSAGMTLRHVHHFSLKTNPVIMASSFFRSLNPHSIVAMGLPAKAAFFLMTLACMVPTTIESALRRGASITVFAQKGDAT